MSIETGKYWIKPVGDDTALIGVDSDDKHAARVVVGGNDNVFTITRLPDGTYVLYLESPTRIWYIQSDKEFFVGKELVVGSVNPLLGVWFIREGELGGYVISQSNAGRVGATLCWTVEELKAGEPVTVKGFPVVPDVQLPEWNIIPWPGL